MILWEKDIDFISTIQDLRIFILLWKKYLKIIGTV